MGYLTLDEVPEGTACRPLFVPDDPLWFALFGGALTELTKVWNYEQFGTLTPQEMADACAVIIEAWYQDECASGGCVLPNDGSLFRMDEFGFWEQLSGEDWIPPDGAATIPTLPDIDAPTEAERRCLAAKNAEYVLRTMYEEIADLWAAEFTLEQMLIDIAAWLVTRLGAWVGIITTQTALVSLGYLAGFYALMEFLTDDLWTTEFTDKLICLLLYHAGNVGDTVVFDFNAVREDLFLQTNWLDPTLADVRLMGQVQYLLQIIGAAGLNHAGATTEIDNTDCIECADEHCYWLDFRTSAHSGEFTIQDGTWVNTLGIRGDFFNSVNRSNAYGYWEFPEDIHLDRVEMAYTKSAGSGAQNVNRLNILGSPVTSYNSPLLDQNVFNTLGTDIIKATDWNDSAGGIGFDLNSGATATDVYVHSLMVFYRGEIPSGWSDNCPEE